MDFSHSCGSRRIAVIACALATDRLPFPVTSPDTPPLGPPRRLNAAIALIVRDGKLLVCQRKNEDAFGGFWEFPGGKCEAGETLHECLARELLEEINVTARPIAQLTTVEHDYPHVLIRLHPFVCRHESGEVQHLQCQASRWIDPSELRTYTFPPANESLIEEAIVFFRDRQILVPPAASG